MDQPSQSTNTSVYSKQEASRPKSIDTNSVIGPNGCSFIRQSYDDPSFLSEIQVEHLISNLMYLDSSRIIIHRFLQDRDDYNEQDLENKLDNVMNTVSGPRTCESIELSGFDCTKCSHFKKCKAPVYIKDDSLIATKDTGFYDQGIDKQGNPKRAKPNYDDLLKYFEFKHSFKTMNDSGLVYTYNKSHWEIFNNSLIKGFAEDNFAPKPNKNMRSEFIDKVKCNNLTEHDWFYDSTKGYINLQNGVFDLKQNKLVDHNEDFGFKYVLPYEYDEKAECPRFEQFLCEVTKGRVDLIQILLEFAGYSFCSHDCLTEKALFLIGSGSNGKSTFMDVLKALAGRENYSSLSLSALNYDHKRYMIDGKLFNIGEETNVKALSDSEVFKTMVTGGEIEVKRLYMDPYIIKNSAKLIISCNDLPKSGDRSDGLYRRMLIVPFDQKFEGEKKDPLIRESLFNELPGIFNMILAAYRQLEERNFKFIESDSVKEALEEYQIENDNVLFWMTEKVIYTGEESDTIDKESFYTNYKTFCESSGLYALNKPIFFKRIRNLLPNYKEVRVQIEYRRVRCIAGVKLNRDA